LTHLQFSVSEEGEQTVVRAAGPLDLSTVDAVYKCLGPLSGRVVVDLSDVTFLDSSGLNTFVRIRNRLLEEGGELRFRQPSDFVRRSIETIGLGEWIDDS
jgi:anti-sigma B factor antagonist